MSEEPGNGHACILCGYRYDPALGDPSQGVPSDTPFADLPADWRCPKCGASRSEFVVVP